MGRADGDKDHQRPLGAVVCSTHGYFLFLTAPFWSLINGVTTRRTVGKGGDVGIVCTCTVLDS